MYNITISIYYYKRNYKTHRTINKLFTEEELEHAINLNIISIDEPYSIIAFMNNYFFKNTVNYNEIKRVVIHNDSPTHSCTFERVWNFSKNKAILMVTKGIWRKQILKSELNSIW